MLPVVYLHPSLFYYEYKVVVYNLPLLFYSSSQFSGSRLLQGVELKIDYICIFGKSQCAFTWVLIRHTNHFLLFSCWHFMLWIKSVVNCCKLSSENTDRIWSVLLLLISKFLILFLFFNLSDQNEEADCWQEVQKGSFMEVHLGPDPPCGGRDPGLC